LESGYDRVARVLLLGWFDGNGRTYQIFGFRDWGQARIF